MKNKKTKMAIISVIALILVTIGITYAYWLVTKTQTGENEITAGCLDIAISGEKNDIELTNQFPMSDEEGMKLVPYEFTVTNNCNTSVDYQVALEATGEETSIISSALKVALNDSAKLYSAYPNVETTIDGAYESRVLGYSKLAASGNEGSSATYSLRIWIDADASISEMNKTFKSRISVTIGQGIESPYEEGTIAYDILANYGGANAISELDASTGVFGNGATLAQTGIYKTRDDLGDSYYYRGTPTNNYVEFGEYQTDVKKAYVESWSIWFNSLEECIESAALDGAPFTADACEEITMVKANDKMYWRIVRINGDGTIRLIYDGTTLSSNGVEGTGFWLQSQFNKKEVSQSAGYTHDDGTGTHVDSKVKELIDAWYDAHLETNYGGFIADSIFCNDKENTNGDDYFDAHDRLKIDKVPKLTCTNKNDRYTVSDTTNGNGFLSNPVGLITADEIIMAGAAVSTNSLNEKSSYNFIAREFLYSFSMTPSKVVNNNLYIWHIEPNGNIDHGSVTGTDDIRPVINIKADVLFTGDGTINNPYKIVTE